MAEEVILTPEGLKKLESELEELKRRRLVVAARLHDARELGDLSENGEYQAAREEQGQLERRIAAIEATLQHARVVDHRDADPGAVAVGSRVEVEVEDPEDPGREVFVIVGPSEADPGAGRISYQSPVGAALMGRRAGESVEVRLPGGGVARYRVVAVRFEES
ncbi:MAG: transcription elongation factor GreA [Clostridia bacterium]|nr:transcription elongation factor GreA [Clostridia bacterium]MCL6522360.1 transcription elongation factor GreA [Bacillota bacterium]